MVLLGLTFRPVLKDEGHERIGLIVVGIGYIGVNLTSRSSSLILSFFAESR